MAGTGRPPLPGMTGVAGFLAPKEAIDVFNDVSRRTGISKAHLMRQAIERHAEWMRVHFAEPGTTKGAQAKSKPKRPS